MQWRCQALFWRGVVWQCRRRRVFGRGGLYNFIREARAGRFALLVPNELNEQIWLGRFMNKKIRDAFDHLRRELAVGSIDSKTLTAALVAELVRL